jgi:hypothetical protein
LRSKRREVEGKLTKELRHEWFVEANDKYKEEKAANSATFQECRRIGLAATSSFRSGGAAFGMPPCKLAKRHRALCKLAPGTTSAPIQSQVGTDIVACSNRRQGSEAEGCGCFSISPGSGQHR